MKPLYVFALGFALLTAGKAQNSPPSGHVTTPALPPRFDMKTMRPPVPLFTPEAQMPDEARRSGKSGMCLMALTVDVKGVPKYPFIAGCSDPMFAANTTAAAMKYRFKPAQTLDGKPIEVMIGLEVHFRMYDRPWTGKLEVQVRYGFFSPPGMTSLEPDANGVYPLSKQLEAPKLIEFVDKDFGKAALAPKGIGCHAVLTIQSDGKPSDVSIDDCDRPDIEKPAVESLLHSKYKPAMLIGRAVPTRVRIHLVYDGLGPFKTATPL